MRPKRVRLESSNTDGTLVLTEAEKVNLEITASGNADPQVKPDTTQLLLRVLERAKIAIQMQATQDLRAEERGKIDQLCNDAHEDFSRA